MTDRNDDGVMTEDDEILFAEETPEAAREYSGPAWKVMIVDDEEEVHNVTHMVLDDYSFEGRGVELISAYSGAETLELFRQHPDTAVILLDVVMETDQAGLEVTRIIRDEIKNRFVRIILRTGQPGQAPERRCDPGLRHQRLQVQERVDQPEAVHGRDFGHPFLP